MSSERSRLRSEGGVPSTSAHGSVELRNTRAPNGGGASRGWLTTVLDEKTDHRTKKFARQKIVKDTLKEHKTFKRVMRCMCACCDSHGVAVVHDTVSGKNAVKGVIVCGSVWLCPVCATKIALQRAEAVTRAVKELKARGCDVLMWTATTRHHAGMSLEAFMDRFKHYIANTKKVKAVKDLFDELRFIGDIKGYEMPVSVVVNGWHLHLHALLVFERKLSEDERRQLDEALFTEWSKQWKKRQLPAPSREHGCDLRRVRDDEAGAYIVKGNAVGVGHEVASGSVTKQAHNVQPLDLPLIAADERYPEHIRERARALFIEYAYATKGRHQMEFSENLRKFLGAETMNALSKTDEQLAAEDSDDTKVIVAGIEKQIYKAITRTALISELLDASEKEGADGIAQLLTRLGIPFAVRSNGRFPIFAVVTVTKPPSNPKP